MNQRNQRTVNQTGREQRAFHEGYWEDATIFDLFDAQDLQVLGTKITGVLESCGRTLRLKRM